VTDDPERPDELIRLGHEGERVRDVQRRLARVPEGGTPGLIDDGVFGQQTLAAVRLFQRTRGLAADGVVGPETWRALTEAAHSLGDRLLWRASTMMRGDDVRELQNRLNRLGFNAGNEDGIFGPLAAAAVEEFQRNVGLPVDGITGTETLEALRRLHRGHQSGGLGIRARQREALAKLAGRGIVGARVLVDAAHGGDDRGRVGPAGTVQADVTWQIARRLTGQLAARGVSVMLSRGPRTGLPVRERARRANELTVDVVLSVSTNWYANPLARGASCYYFGSAAFTSEPGLRLAERIQEAVLADGWRPDCRVHPVTWTLLRETRMPAVVVEPGFLSNPDDEAALRDPVRQDRLAAALVAGLERFFEVPAEIRLPAAMSV
jgi:N-acetylmuramoyl-L-alanine amidase